MTRIEILEKNWKEFRLSTGLKYEPMSDKAYEFMENAMEQYAELRLGGVVKREYMVSGYLDDLPCQVTIEAASREDAIIQAKSDYEDFHIIGARKWIKPDFKTEEDEFKDNFLRWVEDYWDGTDDELWDIIKKSYSNAKIEPLNNKEWSQMANTDSWEINSEEELFKIIHSGYGRDKERIINYSLKPIKEGGIVETPIIAYADGHPPYLVDGNTRLSVCRILGIRPMVTKIKIK
jgi:hypothetical protein